MKIDEFSIDEAKMSPSTFGAAVKEGGTQNVLVGFEFEVCVPKKTANLAKKLPQDYDAQVQYLFDNYLGFSQIGVDNSSGQGWGFVGDDLTPKDFDKLFKLKNPENAVYPTARAAIKAKPTNPRTGEEYEFSDYTDVLRVMLGTSDIGSVERNLSKYFDMDSKRIFKLIKDTWEYDVDEEDDLYYSDAAKVIANNLESTMNRPVHIFQNYHQARKNLTDWYVEPDGSLEPNGSDSSLEAVSPPYPANEALEVLKKFYAMAKQLKLYTSKDNSTGLHINVSIPKTLDVLKLAVFLGDEYVLKLFGREEEEFAQSVIADLRGGGGPDDAYKARYDRRKKNRAMPGRVYSKSIIDYPRLKKIADSITDAHQASISSENKNYISFRQAGGDYLNQYQDVVNIVGRFVQAMIIASDPNMYRQEYLKKLVKLFGAPETYSTEKMQEVQDVKLAIQGMKQYGLPVIAIAMGFAGRGNPNWDSIETDARDRMVNSRTYLRFFDSETMTITNNGNISKKLINSKIPPAKVFDEEREILNSIPADKFVTAITLPYCNVNTIANLYKENLPTINKGVVWSSFNLLKKAIAGAEIRMLPFTDPMVQEFYKKLIRQVTTTENINEADEKPIYYFAYGMLTDPKKMKGIDLVGVAELKNFEYKMYHFANVEPKNGGRVYGCLWEVNREIISHLDRVEGYPNLYDRRTYPVYIDGNKYVAEVYVMTPDTLEQVEGTMPSRDYIESVARGYIHAGIPTEQLQKAVVYAKENAYGY